MAASGNIDNNRVPYVCLSAHCDLLHFVGPVPHPYSGPTPQTIAERASQYVRFWCESPERAPMVTVKCEHPLFTSVPVMRTTDGEPSFPLSGMELARWAFQEHFDLSTVKSNATQQEYSKELGQCLSALQEDVAKNTCGPTIPSLSLAQVPPPLEAETAAEASVPRHVVNMFALRRTILQALFVLNLPKRSPAVSFTVCEHDTKPYGTTRFSVLPRSAEKLNVLSHPVNVNLTVITSASGDTFQCRCFCRHEQGEGGNKALCPPLLWEVNENTQKRHFAGPVEINIFLTETITPAVFSFPELPSKPGESEDVRAQRVVGWSQRRSFQFLALIAHSVWCEKVAWYIMSRTTGPTMSCRSCVARLKTRSDACLDSANKWETTLMFYSTAPNGDHHYYHHETKSFVVTTKSTSAPCALLQVTLRGCDEQISWEWGGDAPRASCGGLQDLTEMESTTA